MAPLKTLRVDGWYKYFFLPLQLLAGAGISHQALARDADRVRAGGGGGGGGRFDAVAGRSGGVSIVH